MHLDFKHIISTTCITPTVHFEMRQFAVKKKVSVMSAHAVSHSEWQPSSFNLHALTLQAGAHLAQKLPMFHSVHIWHVVTEQMQACTEKLKGLFTFKHLLALEKPLAGDVVWIGWDFNRKCGGFVLNHLHQVWLVFCKLGRN